MYKIKKIFLTSLVCISITTNVLSEDIEIKFRIYCEVIDNVVVQVEDGKAKRYSGWEDGFSLGDSVYVEFDFSSTEYEFLDGPSYIFKVVTNFNTVMSETFFEDDFNKITEMQNKTYIGHENRSSSAFLSKDYISLDLIGGSLTFSRYYRDDWSMVYMKSGDASGQVIGGNCMSVPSKYKDMFDTLIKINS